MSIYKKYSDALIYFSAYTPTRYNNIKSDISELLNLILSGNYILPSFTQELENLILDNNEHYLPLISSLFKEKTGLIRKGYSNVKIGDVTYEDPKLLISLIEDNLVGLLSETNRITALTSSDLYVFQLIVRVYFDFIEPTDNIFKFLIRFNDIDSEFTDTNVTGSAFKNIVVWKYLNSVFSKASNQPLLNIINRAQTSVGLKKENYSLYFNNFIDTYKLDITEKIVNYVFSNILFISAADDFREEMNIAVSDLIEDQKIIFDQFTISGIKSNYLYSIIDTLFKNLNSYLTLIALLQQTPKLYQDVSDTDIVDFESIFYSADATTNPGVNYNGIKQSIFEKYKDSYNSIEYIAYQYKLNPILFINSHILNYSKFNKQLSADSLLLNENLFNVDNVSEWTKNLLNQSNTSKTNLIAFVENISVPQLAINEKILKYAINKYHFDIVYSFLNSSELASSIISRIVPIVERNYSGQTQTMYNSTTKTNFFLKVLFMSYLTEDEMFTETYDLLKSSINSIPPIDAKYKIDIGELDAIIGKFNNQSNESLTSSYNNFVNFYISSTNAKLVDGILNNFRN